MTYVVRWNDNNFWLVGPFENADVAADWFINRSNNPTDDPRWTVLDIEDPNAPIPVSAPVGWYTRPGREWVMLIPDDGERYTGLELIGPFESECAAAAWGRDQERAGGADMWQCVELDDPHTPVRVITPEEELAEVAAA